MILSGGRRPLSVWREYEHCKENTLLNGRQISDFLHLISVNLCTFGSITVSRNTNISSARFASSKLECWMDSLIALSMLRRATSAFDILADIVAAKTCSGNESLGKLKQ